VTFLGEILVDGQFVTHRVQSRARHDHRLGFAVDSVRAVRGEVLDHDPHLFADRMLVQINELPQEVIRLVAVILRIVFNLLEQLPIDFVRRVILEHIENELLLDRLPHGVEAEWLEFPVRPLRSE
jgi:hypothetical protein